MAVRGDLRIGSKKRNAPSPPAVAMINAHIKVPEISADHPDTIGAIMEPIPSRKVHNPMILPALCLEK